MRGTCKYVSEAELSRILDEPGKQLAAYPLPLEARDCVQPNDLTGTRSPIWLGGKCAHPRKVAAAADRGAVAAHQDLGNLHRTAYPQVAFPLPALEELLDLQKLIHTQALDATIVLEGKKRTGPLIRKQLAGHPRQVAEIDRVHATVERSADRLQYRPAMPNAGPLRFATAQQLLQHVPIHEGHEPGLVGNAALGVHEDKLPNAQTHTEPLGKIGEHASIRRDPNGNQRLVAEGHPYSPEQRHGNRRLAPARYVDPALVMSATAHRATPATGPLARADGWPGPPGAPDQQQSRRVGRQVGRHRRQRLGICWASDCIVGHRDEQRLTAEFAEVEALLSEDSAVAILEGFPRHLVGRSYHNRLNAATQSAGMVEPAAHRQSAYRLQAVLAILIVLLAWTSAWGGAALFKTGFVAAEHPLAVTAGLEILRQGGNAVDAAIGAITASGVSNPVSCGLGGGGFMLIYMATTGEAYALDYREVAPGTATPAAFLQRGMAGISRGPLSVGIPGEPAGLVAAHSRLGSLSLAAVLAPAIRYARDGFPIGPHLADRIAGRRKLLAADRDLASVFLDAQGAPRREGDLLRQLQLSRSLEILASEGSDPFYRGRIARAISTSVTGRGGLISAEDLATYQVRWRTPLRAAYRGRTVLTMPPPGSGGVLIEALNVLSGYDLTSLGLGSPTYLHLLAETMKSVFEDRAQYYGDPAFVNVPVARLTSSAHAREIRRRLSPVAVGQSPMGGAADGGTAHISVIDSAGNAVAATTTINTAFGSGIVATGTGIILNNQMADFSVTEGAANVFGLVATAANVVAPHKRPLSSMSPTVILRNRLPEIVIGGSGGPMIITGILQTLLGLIDFGLSPPAAAATGRIHHQGIPPVLLFEPSIPERTRESLERLGHRLREARTLGAVSVIHVAEDGSIAGAGAPRKGGAAAGQPSADRSNGHLP